MEIIERRNNFEHGEWVVGGYFNYAKCREERRGSENHRRGIEIEEFKTFIEHMELVDLQFIGGTYT